MARQHGTRSMYNAGCRLECCRRASVKVEKRRRVLIAEGIPRKVPALGSIRRLHSLRAGGWPLDKIAAELGVGMGSMSTLLYKKRTTVTASMHERIKSVFDRFGSIPGPSETTRRRAIAQGYAPPLAWDDDTIDEPDAQPVGTRVGRPSHLRTYGLNLDDWFFLVRAGEGPERAAERCGVKLTAVERAAIRHGRSAEYTTVLHMARGRQAA